MTIASDRPCWDSSRAPKAPALEWNSYAKGDHGAQDKCVHDDERTWDDTSK